MKVQVYTSADYARTPFRPAKLVWRGELPLIPRAGDLIVIVDGFCSEEIARVHWDLVEQEVEITLRTADARDEYPALEPG